jgi:hypothetical protein
LADPRDPVTALLTAGSAEARLRGIEAWAELSGDLDALAPLLADDAPVVHRHGGRDVVTEVRAAALVALQDRFRRAGRAWDLGPVTVRKGMPAEDAVRAAGYRLATLDEARRSEVQAAVDRALTERVQPPDPDREATRAYLVLQQLGAVPYEVQEVDRDLLTPLQREVHGSQMVSERPRPHLRCDGDQGPVGYVWRDERGRWALDFDESPLGREIRAQVERWRTVERGGVPRVVYGEDDRPVLGPSGSLTLAGVVKDDTDQPLEWLRSVGAFLGRKYRCEVVP